MVYLLSEEVCEDVGEVFPLLPDDPAPVCVTPPAEALSDEARKMPLIRSNTSDASSSESLSVLVGGRIPPSPPFSVEVTVL